MASGCSDRQGESAPVRGTPGREKRLGQQGRLRRARGQRQAAGGLSGHHPPRTRRPARPRLRPGGRRGPLPGLGSRRRRRKGGADRGDRHHLLVRLQGRCRQRVSFGYSAVFRKVINDVISSLSMILIHYPVKGWIRPIQPAFVDNSIYEREYETGHFYDQPVHRS